MIYFIFIILGTIIGFIITFLIMKQHNAVLDQQQKVALEKETESLQEMINSLKEQKKLILEEIHSLQISAQQKIQNYYQESYREINQKLDLAKTSLEKQKQQWEKEYENEYLIFLQDITQEFEKQILTKKSELAVVENKLIELESITDAAIEAQKREVEKESKQDFYKIILSERDLDEINKLRQVSGFLRDKEPLNKVIWKIYYEKPTNDLIGRVVGPGIHTGIYKITNLQNNMCYVGQAADIASRWKQHIKRGLGAETPTKNKLYPIMSSIGVENFSFEVIEECQRSQLNEREDYWQKYFHAIDFGYSIK